MSNNIQLFINLANLFKSNGYSLYLVGGSSRDYLLGKEFTDFDLATDATPNEMKSFLKDGDYTYAKFGNVHYKNMDITTLRIEEDYLDSRHPSKIKFVKDIALDYKRRDFTINAIYIDMNLKVFDFANGLDDLNNKVIRFIGDPYIRIKEDPLRILRALRFKKKLGFNIEPNSLKAINESINLLDKLNQDKVKMELKKL